MGFNFLMCKEFSGPSSCCFSCSHKLCCSGRGGALICCQILWGSICAGWRCREHGVVSNTSPNQNSQGGTVSGKAVAVSPSLAGESLVMAPSCYSQELSLGHPRYRLWAAALESRKTALMESSWAKLPAIVFQHPPATAHDAICA